MKVWEAPSRRAGTASCQREALKYLLSKWNIQLVYQLLILPPPTGFQPGSYRISPRRMEKQRAGGQRMSEWGTRFAALPRFCLCLWVSLLFSWSLQLLGSWFTGLLQFLWSFPRIMWNRTLNFIFPSGNISLEFWVLPGLPLIAQNRLLC